VTGGAGYIGSHTCIDMIKAFEKVSGKEVKYQIVDRRPGDIATCYADKIKKSHTPKNIQAYN
jgi:UDP-glucose 4-epimerase